MISPGDLEEHSKLYEAGLYVSLYEKVNSLGPLHTWLEPDAAVLAGCDQPALSADVLRRLIEAYRDRKDPAATMAACAYAGILGVPALFARGEFGRLAVLEGDRGARDLLRERPGRVVRVPWPEGARDVDRPADLPGPACGDPDPAL